MRLINKYDLQDMRKSDLEMILLDNDIDFKGVLYHYDYDELVDLIVDSEKVFVETNEGDRK